MLVTHPVPRWLGHFSGMFPVRCHATDPNMHMSHRVTAVSDQEHIAFFGSLDHDETCHGCSCNNPSITLRQPVGHSHTKRSDLQSPPLSNHFRSPEFNRSNADFVNCGKLPITKIGCRTSKRRPTLGSSSRFVETPACSRVENNHREHVEQATTCRKSPGQKTCATSDVSQLSRLGRSAVRKIPKLSNPASSAVIRVPRGACTSPLAHGCCGP